MLLPIDPLSAGDSLPGRLSSGNPRLALCGLALIYYYAVEIPVDIFLSRNGSAREMSLESRLTHPQIRHGHWGIADLTPFKLQWICSDRNIDGARKVWVTGCVVRRIGPPPKCGLLHSIPI